MSNGSTGLKIEGQDQQCLKVCIYEGSDLDGVFLVDKGGHR